MRILAFDQSLTRTGWAVVETPGRLIEVGAFEARTGSDNDRIVDFCRRVSNLIGTFLPGFLVWEAPSPFIAGYARKGPPDLVGGDEGRWTVNSRQLLLPQLHGVLIATATLRRLPFDVVSAVTWRKAIYGVGRARLSKGEAKRMAVEYCRLAGYTVPNHDAAEATCIALWAAANSQRRKLLEGAG